MYVPVPVSMGLSPTMLIPIPTPTLSSIPALPSLPSLPPIVLIPTYHSSLPISPLLFPSPCSTLTFKGPYFIFIFISPNNYLTLALFLYPVVPYCPLCPLRFVDLCT